MSAPILEKVRIPPPSFFDRFSANMRAERAACTLWNMIAEAGGPTNVSPAALCAFLEENGRSTSGDAWTKASTERFCNYVRLSLASGVSDDCRSQWQAFWRLYQRKPEEMDDWSAPLAMTFLQKWWDRALTTADYPDPSKAELQNESRRITNALGIPESTNIDVSAHAFRGRIRDYWDGMIEEAKAGFSASAAEREKTASLIRQLGITVQMNSSDKELLDRADLLFRIEQNDLTPIDLAINLKKGEEGYYETRAALITQQMVQVSAAQSFGASVNLPAGGGASASIGSYTHKPAEYEEREHADRGDLFITNKAIIFVSSSTLTIRWSQVLRLDGSDEYVAVVRDSGKEVQFEMNDRLDAAIFRALSEKF